MLASAPKLIKAVGEWAGGNTKEQSGWQFGDTITAPIYNAAFQIWSTWRQGGAWPLGNWLKTPLHLLAQIAAIDLTYQTITYTNSKDADWSKLTATQRGIKTWLQI